MKKLASFAVALLASASMFAQSEVGAVSITPKVGLNLCSITNSGDGGKMKVGFLVGAEVGYQASNSFAVTGGLLYSNQGIKYSYDGQSETANYHYLNIPILANYYVTKGLAIKAGIQPGFLVGAKVGSEDIKKGCNTFDFAIPVGLSYEIANVVIDARYNIGLTNTEKESEKSHRNSVFQLSVGYKF